VGVSSPIFVKNFASKDQRQQGKRHNDQEVRQAKQTVETLALKGRRTESVKHLSCGALPQRLGELVENGSRENRREGNLSGLGEFFGDK